jgi:ankyrin repeat protein
LRLNLLKLSGSYLYEVRMRARTASYSIFKIRRIEACKANKLTLLAQTPALPPNVVLRTPPRSPTPSFAGPAEMPPVRNRAPPTRPSPPIVLVHTSFRYSILLKGLPSYKMPSWLPQLLNRDLVDQTVSFSSLSTQRSAPPSLLSLFNINGDTGAFIGAAKRMLPTLSPNEMERKLSMLGDSAVRNAIFAEILMALVSNSMDDDDYYNKLMKWIESVKPLLFLKLMLAETDFAHRQIISQLLKAVIRYSNQSTFNLLLEAGLHRDFISGSRGRQLLLLAVQAMNLDITSRLLDLGAEANQEILIEAIYQCWPVALTKQLLESGVDPDLPSEYGDIPLVRAVTLGNVEATDALLDAGADASCLDDLDTDDIWPVDFSPSPVFEPLHSRFPYRWNWLTASGILSAASQGVATLQNYVQEARNNLFDMETLLEITLYRIFTSSGYGPLRNEEYAEDAINIVVTLLEYGVDPKVKVVELDSPLDRLIAFCKNSKVEINEKLFETLLGHGVSVTGYRLLQLISEPCSESRRHRLQEIRRSSVDINYLNSRLPLGLFPIQDASKKGKYDLVKLLIEEGADVNPLLSRPESLSALHYALKNGNPAVVKLLIDHGAKVNCWSVKPGINLFECFIHCANEDILRTLVDKGAELNDPHDSSTRDWGACLAGLVKFRCNRSLIQRAIALDAEINCIYIGLWPLSTLQWAVERQDLVPIRELIAHGADLNQSASEIGERGRTALQIACETAYSDTENEIIQYLLDIGAEVNAPAAMVKGITALQGAAARGNIEAALLLLERGAVVDAPGAIFDGRTAIEAAAEHGRLDMARILLNAYAERDIQPDCSFALELAEKECHFGVIGLLRPLVK